jgi:CRP/FNR family transcriptional regulator, cyclic AMP receptor protein
MPEGRPIDYSESKLSRAGVTTNLSTGGVEAAHNPLCHQTQLVPGLCDQHPESANPEHLNSCGMRWEHEKDAPAGWELVQALRSPDPRTRGVAASFLARTPDTRIPVDAVRRAGRGQNLSFYEEERSPANGKKSLHGMSIIEDCTRCSVRRTQWFCGLSPAALKELDAAGRPSAYPNGALLFVEGQQARGAYVLCNGQAKLSTTSREGKVLILRIAGPGEVLGLSAALSSGAYELSAETSGPCNINFVERNSLLTVVGRNPEIAVRTALALSKQLQRAYHDVHELVLSRSSSGKLARLLLSWARKREKPGSNPEIRVSATLTHEEMAQMIGTSRETVTRLLGELKKKELIEVDGSTLVIRNASALEALAA